MENCEKYITLKNLDIKAELMFDMVLSLRYEFVLKTDFVKEADDNVFDFNLFFDMPKSAVIGGFELDYGEYSVKSNITEFDDEEKSGASRVILKQISGTCYSFKINNLHQNFGEFNLIIEATALPKCMGNDLIFEIPLYSSTSVPQNIESVKKHVSKAENSYSENIDVSISVAVPNNKELKRMYSSTHEYNILPINNQYIMKDNNYIGKNFTGSGVMLVSTGKSGSVFELCLCYDPSRESIGYVCGDDTSGYSAVYLIRPQVPAPAENADIIYILDTADSSASLQNVAKAALTEFLRNMNRYSHFFISTINGEIYSNEFLAPTLTNIAKVEEWLRNLDSSVQIGEKAYKDAVQKVFDISNGAQIIFITASGLLCRYHNLQNLIIKNVYKSGQAFGSAVQHVGKSQTTFNIVSIGSGIHNGFYEKFSSECLGIFGQMHRGHNFCSFVSGFLKRLCSPYLSNVVISEFAPGTYYMNPKNIEKYRTDEPIILGIRSATDYPREFLIEADGGFSQTVNVNNIGYLNQSRNIDMAFARLALDGIYKLISRSDIAPETVIRFKKRAAQITKEMNVLSPENSCRADIYTKYGHGRSIGNVNFEMSYSFDDEFKNAVTVFGDSSLDYKTVVTNIRIAVAALLVCVRTDGSVSSSYETNFIKRVRDTAYAVSALKQVSKYRILGSDKKFNAIINNANDFASKKNISLSDIPIVFDSKILPPAHPVISAMNVVEISRLILSLLSGMSLA